MLVNGSSLIGRNIMSLQVSDAVAVVTGVVIDPNDLRVIAFVVDGPEVGGEVGNILDTRSVREFSALGFIIDSTDELVEREDVVKINEIMALNFNLEGLRVETRKKSRLGRIIDYTVETGSMMVQQLIVKRPLRKSLMDPELTIGRSQIVEVNDYAVVVRDEEKKIQAKAASEDFVPNFVNPFRSSGAPSQPVTNPKDV